MRRLPLLIAGLSLCFCFSRSSLLSEEPESLDRRRFLALVEEGRSAVQNGLAEQALESYRVALSSAESQRDHLAAAALCHLMGELYVRAGQYQGALIQYERALRILNAGRTGSEAGAIAEALRELQSQEKRFGASFGPPVSVDLYQGELGDLRRLLAQSDAQEHLEILSMINAGNMYLRQSQFLPAEQLYLRALHVSREKSFLRRQIQANLAWSAIKRRDFEKADAILASVLAEISGQSPPSELRRVFLALGVRQREEKQFAKAISSLKQALALYKDSGDDLGRTRAFAHLATTYLEAGALEEAEEQYVNALQLNQDLKDVETAWHAHGGLAQCYQKTGDLPRALRHFELYLQQVDRIGNDFSTDQGRISFLEDHDRIFGDYAQAALSLAEEAGEYQSARRAIERLREQALASLQLSRLTRLSRSPGRLPGSRVFDSRHFFDDGAGPMSGSNSIEQMAVGVPSPPPEEVSETETHDDTAAMVPPATFLEYYVLPDRTAILLKNPEGHISGAIAEIGSSELDRLISEYRRALQIESPRGVILSQEVTTEAGSSRRPSPEEIGDRLYALLVRPVEEFLRASSTVVIVPHRSLWLLPFAALRDSREVYLGDRCVLTYAPSEAIWRRIAAKSRPSLDTARAWIVGNPRMPHSVDACGFPAGLQPLPGAEDEARAIASLFGPERAELFVGSQGDALRLEAWHSDFTIFHLATHGFSCPEDPLSSFLVLSPLGPDDIALEGSGVLSRIGDRRLPVNIQGLENTDPDLLRDLLKDFSHSGALDARAIIHHFRLRADLVTLSACQTGLGRILGQGHIGFTRTFLAAGARSLLVSLWRVDDRATRDLMVVFYEEYLQHGNKALALQRAMQQVRARDPDPKYWAAFTLIGVGE